jgi:hypothetical protein
MSNGHSRHRTFGLVAVLLHPLRLTSASTPNASMTIPEMRLTHSRNPVERLVRDAVLSEEEAEMGRMFLDVAQIVHL